VAERLITKEGRSNIVTSGLEKHFWNDLYHAWLTASWPRAFAFVGSLYLAVNFCFALAYLASGGIENAQPGSFADAFFFSVQTLATIGYGRLSPVSLPAHLLVTVESFFGITGVAMITGLMFAKFARPTARVLWSEVCVIALQDGVPALMFRVANARGNQVVEAQVRVGLMRDELTAEGEQMRRIHDLKLVRASSAIFALSWLVVHPINAASPLFGETEESLQGSRALLFVSLTGLDETFNQTIHARHAYEASEFAWGRRFVDIMGPRPDGRTGIDYSKFHETRPAPFKKEP
jgi:inward rectifier potassium channel